jgi:hypothetical protein
MTIITTEQPSPTSKTAQTNIEQSTDDLSNLVDGRNKPLVIILAVTLPTLAFIGILILLIVFYRRRHATIWLKKIGKILHFFLHQLFSLLIKEHSSRLQAIVVNISSTPIQSEYD